MSDFLEQFSTYLRAEQGAAENTVSSYLFDVRRFEEWLGSRDKRIETVTRAEIQEYFAWLMQDGVSARSVRRALATLKRFYGLLLDDETVRVNPTKGIPPPKMAQALPKTLSGSDVNKMVRWVSRKRSVRYALRDKAILLTFYASGLRESELANLNLVDVDLDGGFVKIWDGKGGKDGIAPLSPPAIAALQEYLEKLRPKLARDKNTQTLFLGRDGEPFTRQRVWQIVSRIAGAAIGKRVSPHMLRHSCATALVQGGADIRDVQAILRHSDINTSQIYVHTDITYLRRIYDRSHPRA